MGAVIQVNRLRLLRKLVGGTHFHSFLMGISNNFFWNFDEQNGALY